MKLICACPNCGQQLEAGAEAVGTQVECPGCRSVLTVPRKELGPGATIGGFQIQRFLGRGGMGEVWLAAQLSLQRDVALKVLPPQLGMNPDTAKRFVHEVRMLARLNHPNIVPAWEAGEDDGFLFFAMQFVPGESLEARLQREGAIAEASSLRLAAKVGGALAYAWSQHQMLHRDIKPSNILLDEKGEPHVVDLGLAKSLAGSVNLTMSGGVMGTPNYMSPEQARGEGQIDCRTDIYSLGMTLYHMVTGQVPFESPSPMETMRKQIMEPLPDPREFNPSVSEPCVVLLETMLAKAPSGRHDTWEVLLEDLRLVLGGEHPSRVLGAAGGSVLTVRRKGGRTIPPAPAPPTSPRRAAGAAPRQKSLVPLIAGITVVLVALAALGFWMLVGKEAARTEARSSPPSTAAAKPAPTATNAVAAASAGAPPAYLEALEYVRRHPRNFDEALARFEKAQKAASDPALAIKVTEEIAQLTAEKAKAIEQALASLKAEAEQAAKDGRFEEVLKKLEDASGPFAEVTAAARAELVAKLREQQATSVQAKQAAAQAAAAAKEQEAEARRREALQAKLGSLLSAAANDVVRLDCTGASKRLSEAMVDPELSPLTNELAEAHAAVSRLVSLSEAVLAGFEREKGQETLVEFANGQKLKLTVLGVNAGKVSSRQALGSAGFADRSFSVAELAPSEKYRRLSSETRTESQLMRGYLACAIQNWGIAEKEWAQAGTRFAGTLAEQARARAAPTEGSLVETAAVKVPVPKPFDSPPAAKPADSKPAATAPALHGSKTTPGKEAAPLHVPLKAATEENVKQALAALKSQLDSPAKYTVHPGGITFDLSSNQRLQNIHALAGLPITELNLRGTAVKDLTPLVGMPLTKLNIMNTKVIDLKPVGKITSLEELNGQNLLATDYSPVRGLANLHTLNLRQSGIKNLGPLDQLVSLRDLDLSLTGVEDLSPLRGLSQLTDLRVVGCTKVHSLAPLNGMNLQRIFLEGSAIEDISPVRNLPMLTQLSIGGMPTSDWTPLTGMLVNGLAITGKVNSPQLLKGLSVRTLQIVMDEAGWPDCAKDLPSILPNVQRVMIQRATVPPSRCPDFVFLFPSLTTISWTTTSVGESRPTMETLSVEAFKEKYLQKAK